MRAKLKSTKPLVNRTTIQPKDNVNVKGWKSMTNWLIVLVSILPLLVSFVTMDPVLSIRYIFLSWFVLLFVFFFYGVHKTGVNIPLASLLKWIFLLGIIYGGWSLISLVFSINKPAAFYEVARHLQNVVLLFLVMITVRREGASVLKLCKALVVVSIIQSMVGICQYFEIAFTDIPGMGAPYGLMSNRNLFGSAQVFTIPFVLFVLYKGGKVWKYLSIIACTGLVVSIVISQTRSAWLAFIVLLLTSGFLLIRYSTISRKKLLITTLSGAAFIAALVFLLVATYNPNSLSKTFSSRVSTLIQLDENDLKSSSEGLRLNMWKKSIRLIKDHPLAGVGLNNWNIAIWSYGSNETDWDNGKHMPGRPHNIYLQVASEAGLPGALIYFGMWVLIIVAALKTIRSTQLRETRVLVIFMLSGLAAFLTDGLFGFPTERIEHSLYIILAAGIILGCYNTSPLKENKNKMKPWLIWIAVFIAAFNAFIGYEKYNFEKHMNLAIAYRGEKRFPEVISEVEAGKSKWVTIGFNGDPLEIHSSVAYREQGDYVRAIEEIQTAKSYHPFNSRIFNIEGVLYSKLKQYGKAIESYLKAIQLTPKNEAALKNLAMVYYESGNYAACIETILKMPATSDPYIMELLSKAQRQK